MKNVNKKEEVKKIEGLDVNNTNSFDKDVKVEKDNKKKDEGKYKYNPIDKWQDININEEIYVVLGIRAFMR